MKALILLHGALANKYQFDPLLPLLPHTENFAMDFPGHGAASLHERDFTLKTFADSVLELMDSKGLVQAGIFGYSMGGYVGMYLAKHYPERVSRLITLSTKYHWNPEHAVAENKKLDPVILEQKAPDFIEALNAQHPISRAKDILEHTAQFLTELGTHNYLMPEEIKEIQTPCCIAVGDRDKMVTLEETVATYKSLANAQFAVLPGTPHLFEKMDMRKVAGVVNSL